jgi:hypothetical protein
MIFGYARVSKAEAQDTRMQEAALRAAGATKVLAEQASGGRWERPALHLYRVIVDMRQHFTDTQRSSMVRDQNRYAPSNRTMTGFTPCVLRV